MKKNSSDAIERIEVPHSLFDLAKRRTRGILRAAVYDPNVLESLALSCYVQGLEDGYDTATTRATEAI